MQKSQKNNLIVASVVALMMVAFVAGYFIYIYSVHGTSIQALTTANDEPCSTSYPNGGPVGAIFSLGSGSSASLCVKYYYYNLTSEIALSPASQIQIIGQVPIPHTNTTRLENVNSSEFTIQSSYKGLEDNVAPVNLGGQSNANEGSLVVYSITASSSTPSGAYFISLGALVYPGGTSCETQAELLVGNVPVPLGVSAGGGPCLGPVKGPANSQGFVYGDLYVEIAGTTSA